MKSINGQKFLTLNVTANEVYAISYANKFSRTTLKNDSNSYIYVSDTAAFTEENGVGRYIALAPGSFINDLSLGLNCLYIKSSGNGKISIVRCA